MPDRRRVYRVAERIRELIATELLQSADPRLLLVTVTSVVVSADLREAKVYWNVSGGEDRMRQAEQAFKGGADRHLRAAIGGQLGLRFVPSLTFFYDDTLDTSERVEKLLAKVREEGDEELLGE